MNRDILTVWRENGFTLMTWDTHRQDSRRQTVVGYKLWDNGKPIFEGDDFAGSPMHADDSIQNIASLLGFLSLKFGDTDQDYFANYTPTQIEWMESGRADDLSLIVYDLEERKTA